MEISRKANEVEFIVFLDRDGVINRKLPGDRFVCHWDEFEFLPRAAQAIRTLNQFGCKTIVVTNQRGISLGLYTERDLQDLHARMMADLRSRGARIDAIYYCPHAKKGCLCRKPGTALFEQAFHDFPRANASTSIVVGDSLSDMQAAHALGCKKVLVTDHHGSVEEAARQQGIRIDFSGKSLIQAVEDFILPTIINCRSSRTLAARTMNQNS